MFVKLSWGLEIGGSILVNGEAVGANMSDFSAYVQQNDVFIGSLTVIGTIIFLTFDFKIGG